MSRKHDVLTFRLDPAYREKLEAKARASGLSVSAYLRAIVIEHTEDSRLATLYRGMKTMTESLQSLHHEVREHRKEFRDAIS